MLARLHPLLVHFPIGALVIAFFLELLTLRDRQSDLRPGIRWLVYIGAGTALVSAVVGLMLAYGQNYSASTLFYHRWGGILTAVLACITAGLLYRADRPSKTGTLMAYRGTFAVVILVLTVTGHFGASLTHGDDYITSALPWNYEPLPTGEFSDLVKEVKQHQKMGEIAEKHKTELNVGVRRIFAKTCYRCHDSEKSEGDLKLTSRENVMKGGENGPIVVPGKPEESELVRRVSLPGGHEDAMPKKDSSLTESQVALIRTWIDVGAPWADREVKAFREAEIALEKPEVPETTSTFDNPLDKLTNAYFKEHDIKWREPVDDRTFIRRVYLDVIGLLPKPEQIKAFVADPSSNKRERLIERLLNRRHAYAQHWLTFWNDLLRNDYEGTGFITGGREQITDWLYESLYENKPYNRMVHQLIDPNDRSEGFIKGIQWRGAVNASQTTEMQAAQNISQSLLGKNLKCASCHDSFVSNLTLQDAYSFAQIFSKETLKIQRCDVPTGKTAEASFLYSEELGDVDPDAPKGKRLAQLADIITSEENGRLYRTAVNRYWKKLMGRGLVEPVDKMDNIPWSQKHLDWLAADLRKHDYDLKHLLSTILTSRTYQLPAMNASGNNPSSEDFVFRGPTVKRMTAEQFADGVSRVAAPLYSSGAYNPYETTTAEANWIWTDPESNRSSGKIPPGTRFFRNTFNLPENRIIVGAELLITADNSYTLFVNGTEVGSDDSWKEAERFDVSSHLRNGKNVLAVEAANGGSNPNPAGLLVNLQVQFTDVEETFEVRTERSWKTRKSAPSDGWTSVEYDDGDWGQVVSFGTATENDTWGDLQSFTHSTGRKIQFVRASLVPNDDLQKALGRPPRENVVTNRQEEVTLLQALELSNGKTLNEVLTRGAERLIRKHGSDNKALIEELYYAAYSRPPTDEETKRIMKKLTGPLSRKHALEDVLWAIFMNPEFQLIK